VIVCATLAELEQRSPVGRSEVAFVTDVGKQFFYVDDSRTLSRDPAVALPVIAGGCLVTPEGGNSRWVWFGHKAACRLNRDGVDQALAAANNQNINWTHVSYDTYNLATLSSGVYSITIARGGYYYVSASGRLASQSNSNQYTFRLMLNSANLVNQIVTRPGGGFLSLSASTVVWLDAGDNIAVWFNSPNTVDFLGGLLSSYLEVIEQ
jgi:hypothetical protein